MATVIGDLAVRVGADTSGLTAGLDKAQRRTQQVAGELKRTGAQLVKFGAAAAAAGAALAAGLVAQSINSAREMHNMAKIAGASVPQFQKMAFAAKGVGIQSDKLSDILKDMQDRVGDFLSTGGGPMADFFEKIAPKVGVTAEQFRHLSGPQALQLYVSSLEKANLSQSEMTFFMETIASDSIALLPLLRDNGKAMAEQARQAERLGIVLSTVETKNIEQAARQMDRVLEVGSGFVDQFTAELSPVISALGKQFIGAAEDAGGVGNAAATSFNTIVDAVAVVLNALDALDRGLLESQTSVDKFALLFRIGLLEIAREIVEIPTAAVNEMIALINNIPGVNVDALGMSDFGRAIQGQINSAKGEISSLQTTLETELSKPLAGDALKRFVIGAQEAARQSQAALAGVGDPGSGGGSAGGPTDNATGTAGGDSPDQESSLSERLSKRLALIRQFDEFEIEALDAKLKIKQEKIAEALEAKAITDAEAKEISLVAEEEHQAAINEIHSRATKERTRMEEQAQQKINSLRDSAVSNAVGLLNVLGRKNKAAAVASIAITKGLAIAQTMAHTQTAAMLAYASQLMPGDPTSLAKATAAYAKTQSLGNISAGLIAATGIAEVAGLGGGGGGGGSGGSSGGGGSVAPAAPQQTLNVSMQGFDPNSLYTGNQVGGLLDALSDEAGERGLKLLVSR